MKYEYKVEHVVSSVPATENIMNEYAAEGWRVINATDHLLFLEREKHYDEIDYDTDYAETDQEEDFEEVKQLEGTSD